MDWKSVRKSSKYPSEVGCHHHHHRSISQLPNYVVSQKSLLNRDSSIMTRWPWNGLSTQTSFHFSPLQVCQKAKFMIINLCLLTNNRSTGKTPKQLPINASIHFSLANIRENDSIIFRFLFSFFLLKSDKKKLCTSVILQAFLCIGKLSFFYYPTYLYIEHET